MVSESETPGPPSEELHIIVEVPPRAARRAVRHALVHALAGVGLAGLQGDLALLWGQGWGQSPTLFPCFTRRSPSLSGVEGASPGPADKWEWGGTELPLLAQH